MSSFVKLYEVNPANSQPYNITYLVGQEQVTLQSGFEISRIQGPVPQENLYLAVDNTVVCGQGEQVGGGDLNPDYYDGPTRLFFEQLDGSPGVLGSDDARVREELQCDRISIDELYRDKLDELDLYTFQVFTSAFQFDFGGLEFWALHDRVTQPSRADYNGYLATRGLDILFDAVQEAINAGGGVNAEVATWWNAMKARQTGSEPYWKRDIRVFLYERGAKKRVRDNANQNQWGALSDAQGTFTHQVRQAGDRVLSDIDAAYADGQGDWATLASIDVAHASYNWPPHISTDELRGNGTTTINRMRGR